MTAAFQNENVRVLAGSLGALAVSYTGLMDALRLILLVLSITYTAIKLCNAMRHRDRDSD
jgi:hypothetical protein